MSCPSHPKILPPKSGYILCTSPRSGSTLLCDLLTSTGVAGKPNSFFRPQSIADFCDDWSVPRTTIEDFDFNYLKTANQQGRNGNDCFGMRMMFSNMKVLQDRLCDLFPNESSDKDRFTAAFGPLSYLRLLRKDTVAEAVSYVIADQSGLWHRFADGTERERVSPPESPTYDFNAISEKLALLENEKRGWTDWLNSQGITPLEITYEDLSKDPQSMIATILEHVGQDPSKAALAKPISAKLSSELNNSWAKRFRADSGLQSDRNHA